MQIIKPPEFLSEVKNAHVLLDTSVFIDTALHLDEFSSLLNEIKASGATLVTISAVIGEFLEGAANDTVYKQKRQLIDNIIDACIPVSAQNYDSVYDIIRLYRQEGKGKGSTDFL